MASCALLLVLLASSFKGSTMDLVPNASNPEFPNCTRAAIEEFPRPLMSPEVRSNGGIMVDVFAAIYIFIALSVICEDYFVPSLEVICDALHVDPDVAGATFMAAASSVPAIAASIIAILLTPGDMGVSTALGSAVLNAAGVVSVSALFAGKVVVLHRWPMYRDSIFLMASVVLLLVSLQDEQISVLESVLLLLFYAIYGVFMGFDARAEEFFLKHLPFLRDESTTLASTPPSVATVPMDPRLMSVRRGSQGNVVETDSVASRALHVAVPASGNRAQSLDVTSSVSRQMAPRRSLAADTNRRRISLISLRSGCSDRRTSQGKATSVDVQVAALEEMALRSTPSPRNTAWHWIIWLILLPLKLFLRFTVPDCKKENLRAWFPVTFIMSTLHISLLSYVLVWLITIIGFTLGISDTVMGLTFLSIGVTLPDIIASLLVVRRGWGDMAVCNALGSNIFEILVGLGLPWFIQTVLLSRGTPAVVQGQGMAYATACLLSTIVFLLLSTHLNKWKMNKLYGMILMVWYLIFMVLACLYELNFFGLVSLPSCDSDY